MKFWKAPILAMAVLLAAPPASAADVEWHGYFQTLHGAGTSETRGLDGQWLASREKLGYHRLLAGAGYPQPL